MNEPNSYSRSWFQFFHIPIGEERTEREMEFVCAVAPLPEFRNALDVCCGMGRHARALAARGYSVTAVDRDSEAIRKARELAGGPKYIESDVRDHQPARSAYDLAIVMSQSFGYFDSETNRNVLGRLGSGVRKGGRIVLDLWNLDFFSAHQGQRDLETAAGIVREKKRVEESRLFVHLTYPDKSEENFEWQLFAQSDMQSLAQSAGLAVAVACADFNSTTKPNAANPRIQFVLQKL
jgi:SAM-dependent methyltransferase